MPELIGSFCPTRHPKRSIRRLPAIAPVRVADYLLDKDRLFARITLDEAEYELYEQVYAKLGIEAPPL